METILFNSIWVIPLLTVLVCAPIPAVHDKMLKALHATSATLVLAIVCFLTYRVYTLMGTPANEAAAVGSTAALINLLIGFFLGLATGTGILYAMHYGAGETGELKKIISSALILAAIAGAAISLFGILFARQLLLMMHCPADVLPLSETYLRIYLAGTVVNLLYNVSAGIIRAGGDSRRPLVYLLCSGLTNLVLDLLFVAVFRWGVAGAALATIIAQGVSAVLTVRRLTRLPESYRLRLKELRVDGATCRRLARVSLPCGLQGSMFNIANLLVQTKINGFGSVAMAGIAAYGKIDGFLYMPMMALSMAASTFVGQNVGAGQYDRVRRGVRTCLLLAGGLSVVTGGIVFFTADTLLDLFTKEAPVKAVAMQYMRYMAPFAWTFVFSDILGGSIRGAGQTMQVTVISALCICLFRILWLTIGLHLLNDIRLVFLCYPLSWTLSSIVMLIYYFRGRAVRNALTGRTPALQ